MTNDANKPESGVRAPPLSFTSDCDMPRSPEAPPSAAPGSPGQRQKLLVGVQPAAVLAVNMRRWPPFHRAKQKAGERQSSRSFRSDHRIAGRPIAAALRHLASSFTPRASRPVNAATTMLR